LSGRKIAIKTLAILQLLDNMISSGILMYNK